MPELITKKFCLVSKLSFLFIPNTIAANYYMPARDYFLSEELSSVLPVPVFVMLTMI